MTRLARYMADALILLGAGLVVAGAWIIYPPIALIVAGFALVFLAVIGGRHGPTG